LGIHRLCTTRGVPLTVHAVTKARAHNPEAAAAMIEAEWKIASLA
jgi:hypothetical protein